MRKKIIQIPKDYLSYSQVSLWMSDKNRYKEIYFNNNDYLRFSNPGLDYGKKVATALENEKETGDLLTDTAMELLPKYDIQDQEIRTILKTKDGYINLIGRPDSLDSKTKNFYEFKTGKFKWTQKKAENSLQLKFYAMMIFIEYKVLPNKTSLIWIETFADTDGQIKPTGRVETFQVHITMSDIINTMATVSRVAKEIEAEWLVHVPPVEEPF